MTTTTRPPRAPKDLGPTGRRFWRTLTTDYDFAHHELAILRAAARTVDRLEALAEAEATADVLIDDPKRGLGINPVIVEQRQASQALARLIASLRIPEDGQSSGAGRGAHRTPKRLAVVGDYDEDAV
jgi:hypothetical protein